MNKLVLLVAIMVACVIAVSIIDSKSSTASGEASTAVRIDHVFACLQAFLHSPIIGVGYANTDAVLEFAINKQGISVGLPYLMASGGLILTLILLIPIFHKVGSTLKNRKFNFLFWEMSIVFLYFFTAITSAPLFLMLNGFMYVDRENQEKVKDAIMPYSGSKACNVSEK